MFSFSSALISAASVNRGGRLGEVLGRVRGRGGRAPWPTVEVGEERVFLLAGRGEDPPVAVELEDLPLGLEDPVARLDRDVGDREDGGRHLAGDEPPVDQE